MRKPWTYKGITIWPAEVNGSGIRWTALGGLKADTKQSMRDLINRRNAQ